VDETGLNEVFGRRMAQVHRLLRIGARYDVGPPGVQ
ncbi:uncharacterized protein METZ01_LOCUS40942, partial [marine metagenome]